jgi:hypothetical protein
MHFNLNHIPNLSTEDRPLVPNPVWLLSLLCECGISIAPEQGLVEPRPQAGV